MRRSFKAGVGAALAAQMMAWAPGAVGEPAQAYRVYDLVATAQQLAARKDYAGALKRLDEQLRILPGDIVAIATRGNVYLETGDYPRAIADHDAVLDAVGHEPSALINACWARAVANVQLDRALAYCDEAAAAARTRAFAAYDTRGFVHFRRGEFDLAIADYDAALKAHRRLASSLYGRGLAKARLGHQADGRADLAAAVKIEPGIAERYERWGARP